MSVTNDQVPATCEMKDCDRIANYVVYGRPRCNRHKNSGRYDTGTIEARPPAPADLREAVDLAAKAFALVDRCVLYGPHDATREAIRKFQAARAALVVPDAAPADRLWWCHTCQTHTPAQVANGDMLCACGYIFASYRDRPAGEP